MKSEVQFAWRFRDDGAPGFVLTAGGRPIGGLEFAHEAGVRSAAEWEGRRWTLEHSEARYPSITVRAEGSEDAAAVFASNHTGGGTVTFASGARYWWSHEHFWTGGWCFRSCDDRSAVCVTQHAGPLTAGGQVTVCDDTGPSAETPLLVLLAWYLRLLQFDRLADSICLGG